MPAFITHLLFGEEVQLRLHPQLQELLEQQPADFYWGLQGPDLLLFRQGDRLPALGRRLHRERTGELLRLMCLYIRRRIREGKSDAPALCAYFYGFLCHYALDSHCHPYVYYLEERRKIALPKAQWGGIHHQIESQLDSALCQKLRREKVSAFRIAEDCAQPHERAIGRLYRQIFHSLCGVDVPVGEVAAAFEDARQAMKWQVKSSLIPAAKLLEKWLLREENSLSACIRPAKVEVDVLNEDRGLWAALDAPDDSRSSSFLELMYDAEEAAVEAIALWANALGGAALPEWRECVNFDCGCP